MSMISVSSTDINTQYNVFITYENGNFLFIQGTYDGAGTEVEHPPDRELPK